MASDTNIELQRLGENPERCHFLVPLMVAAARIENDKQISAQGAEHQHDRDEESEQLRRKRFEMERILLMLGAVPEKFEKRTDVAKEIVNQRSIFLITDGHVIAYQGVGESGCFGALLGRGELVGEFELLEGLNLKEMQPTARVHAVQTVHGLRIAADTFARVAETEPKLWQGLAYSIVRKSNRDSSVLKSKSQLTDDESIILTICELMQVVGRLTLQNPFHLLPEENNGETQFHTVRLPSSITVDAIAGLTRTTSSFVKRVLRDTDGLTLHGKTTPRIHACPRRLFSAMQIREQLSNEEDKEKITKFFKLKVQLDQDALEKDSRLPEHVDARRAMKYLAVAFKEWLNSHSRAEVAAWKRKNRATRGLRQGE